MWIRLLVVLLVATTQSLAQETLLVPEDYDTIQDAIDVAEDGDTVLVDPETYYENLDFLGKSITLESVDGPEETIIDGSDLTLGEDQGACINIVDATDGATVIGFTLRAGEGTEQTALNGSLATFGGGLYALDSTVVMENCVVEDSGSTYSAVFFEDCEATLENCQISDNNTGGLRAHQSALTTVDCEIMLNNSIAIYGFESQLSINGGSISENYSPASVAITSQGTGRELELTDCVIEANDSVFGSCIWVSPTGPEVTISSCQFLSNTPGSLFNTVVSITGDAVISDCLFEANESIVGGGLALKTGNTRIERCVFRDNDARDYGGAISAQHDLVLDIDRCTFVGNSAGDGDVLHMDDLVSPPSDDIEVNVTNSILWDTGDDLFEIVETVFDLSVTYSCVEGDYDGDGNIDEDPLFVDLENGDFHLTEDSPCIDAGNPDDEDSDETVADMGAFPFIIERTFLRGDVNGNGTVTALSDALRLLTWLFDDGDEPPCLDAADVDDSGAVGALVDSLGLLAWGFDDGAEPPAPGPDTCGTDPTEDDVSCEDPLADCVP